MHILRVTRINIITRGKGRELRLRRRAEAARRMLRRQLQSLGRPILLGAVIALTGKHYRALISSVLELFGATVSYTLSSVSGLKQH